MKNQQVIIYQIICLLLILSVTILLIRQQKQTVEQPMTTTSVKDAALSVIYNRKSVRNFIPNKPISKEDINTIIKAGMSAPSGKDTRPWEIIVIDDQEILQSLATKLPHAKMLAQSPLAMVVCGDTTKSSYWYVDCSAVTENILLAVEAMELGAVWTAAYPYQDRMDAVIQSVNLPENILPLCVIPMGYPKGEHQPKDKYDETKIHYNKW
ncbi:MAG: nitroreductase family protein [Bacteroidales bacterium]|jgi:nitroreductase|nr:nitroreductase family protein [Bacteroidales bacterium]